jgi:cyanate permease
MAKEIETTATTEQDEMTALSKSIKTTGPYTQGAQSVARARGWRAVLALMALLTALFLIAMLPRWRANAALESAARDQRPTVSVVSPERANAKTDLALPGR